ncbi:hypothetical protein ALT_5294 [Aspergillus lentulus]|uniref:Uncharacterized protein n=1 Tax=Aspergillus lentulus TaxID=293939 RepID=A0AAN4TB74_ASPLE|nr:uncharacterized protein IFM58399_00830 [Aspergillus lentulus]KAF4160924.1 hypothetical protein CNMCM6069_006832 [Aspergillus lentulus]KAF4169322.1 hypothetical protein CNMCM6936_008682 [Aspergillus lentulus]KAF4180931.1 hypothetical protein CNMCM8060_000406 [Aspergillus lentulus]KAF4189322.1 hypothetical protein CNMCM7927_008610 [Aspergillus lentulus]KAF4197487.1 hypothetical protein CNMCM8694_002753 [Aspergillus lentulus]
MYYQYYDPPPSPEPLESGVFTYGKDGIKAGGFTRAHSAVTSLRNPFSVIAIERSLAEQYRNLERAREERISREYAAKFATLGTPSLEARFDPRFFHCQTLMDRISRKAVQAVPGLVAHIIRRLTLVGWEDSFEHGLDAAFAARSAPGARFHIPTSEANFDLDRFMAKYTILGWDIAKVIAIKKGHEDERERKKAEEEAEKRAQRQKCWHEALQPHRDYMRNYHPPAGPLALDDIVGSYTILCEAIDEHLGNYHDELTLEIQKPASANGVVAAFNLDLVEGTMLLALSDDALHRLREEQPPELTYYEKEDEDRSDSYESNSNKRKGSELSGGQAIRRWVGEIPNPNRVYLQWGGRVVLAEIEVDEGNEHTGYLDFDASRATARGEWAYPALWGKERKIAFSIINVEINLGKLPEIGITGPRSGTT